MNQQHERETMSLSEALTESRPLPPIQQTAYKALKGGRCSVAHDGRFWDLLYLGSPFGFETQADLEGFLKQEDVDLQVGWRLEIPEAQR